jgi:hypothetical protein
MAMSVVPRLNASPLDLMWLVRPTQSSTEPLARRHGVSTPATVSITAMGLKSLPAAINHGWIALQESRLLRPAMLAIPSQREGKHGE